MYTHFSLFFRPYREVNRLGLKISSFTDWRFWVKLIFWEAFNMILLIKARMKALRTTQAFEVRASWTAKELKSIKNHLQDLESLFVTKNRYVSQNDFKSRMNFLSIQSSVPNQSHSPFLVASICFGKRRLYILCGDLSRRYILKCFWVREKKHINYNVGEDNATFAVIVLRFIRDVFTALISHIHGSGYEEKQSPFDHLMMET